MDKGVPHLDFSELVTISKPADGVPGGELDVAKRALASKSHIPPVGWKSG
jgi:hypothetical protein